MALRMPHFSVFSHLSSPKVEEYRRVLEAFAAARSAFVIHLRPFEIARATGFCEEALEAMLEQLVEWGNLDHSRDHVDAASIQEFYRVKWLYQLSARGEAAERALLIFEESLHQKGELQTAALREIIEYLEAIHRLLDDGQVPDFAKLLQQYDHLNNRFENFTVQAQRFMQFLQGTIELHGLSLEDFLDYKDRLIDYLQRFVGELITSTNEIERKLTALERAHVRACFPGLARQARIDALDPSDPEELAADQRRREGRWDGLRRWFLGSADGHSQAETLRARAREAIPALLVALQSFHDQRETGSDRRRDWRQLAHWFAEMPDDAMAHRLWQVAFALAPARHLRVNDETLRHRDQSDEGPRTSWLAAEPMWLEPQLRKSGRAPQAGRGPEMVDLSREREFLRRLAEEENSQIERAHALLVRDTPLHLSDFETLEPVAFDLLLDLLGEALANHPGLDSHLEATSSDGSLVITLWPPADPARVARLQTTHGVLTGPDFRVAIRRTAGAVLSRAS